MKNFKDNMDTTEKTASGLSALFLLGSIAAHNYLYEIYAALIVLILFGAIFSATWEAIRNRVTARRRRIMAGGAGW